RPSAFWGPRGGGYQSRRGSCQHGCFRSGTPLRPPATSPARGEDSRGRLGGPKAAWVFMPAWCTFRRLPLALQLPDPVEPEAVAPLQALVLRPEHGAVALDLVPGRLRHLLVLLV